MNDMDGINYEKMNIQWFPGHMTKAQRMIEDSIKQVDAVCEILDARIPNSSRNPDIDRLAAGKPRLIILNRTDLADPNITAQWRTFFEEQGIPKISILETKRVNTLYYFQYSSVSTRKIYDILYYKNCLCLPRKKDKYEQLLTQNLKK